MFGLSIDGPGNRTAEPVPYEMTRNPALLLGVRHTKQCYQQYGLTQVHDGPPWIDSKLGFSK